MSSCKRFSQCGQSTSDLLEHWTANALDVNFTSSRLVLLVDALNALVVAAEQFANDLSDVSALAARYPFGNKNINMPPTRAPQAPSLCPAPSSST